MQNDTIPQPPGHEHYQPVNPQPGRPRREGWRSITSTLLILILAPLIALFLTAFVFQSYQVEGESMEATLQDGDRLIVWKLGKTLNNVGNDKFIPKRGEVVIFHRPQNAGVASESNKQLIKRVVALPGERIVITQGVVTVYNQANPDGFQPDQIVTEAFTDGEVDEVIKPGHVFVLGDNRGNSLDSRNFGQISTDLIVGSLAARIFPLTKIDTF